MKWLIKAFLVIMPTNTLWSHALIRACLSHFKLADNMPTSRPQDAPDSQVP